MAISEQILQQQDNNGMLRRALERIIQLYTDKSHFIYELLQNAEDAGATTIKFEQYPDRLIVLHDGRPFSVENLQGLCDIGMSDKSEKLNQIGQFGVGFKSVFGICETVQLFSHPSKKDQTEGYPKFAVEITDFTHPRDIDDQEIERGYTTKFIFPYQVGFTFSSFTSIKKLNEVLSKRLQNLGITTLLFMKNLTSIDYRIELPELKTSGAYLLENKQINDHCSLVSAIGEDGEKKQEESSYLIFSRQVSGMNTGKTIDIAFSVTVNEKKEYAFIASKSPYISVYFPTETESKLKFIVQGPYRTAPNRSSVPADDADNIKLANQTATLLRDSVIELRDTGKLDYSLLNILPIDSEVFENAPLFETLYKETAAMMKEEKLFLCKDKTYALAYSVKIARNADLTEVFTDELLTELLEDGTNYHWMPTFLTETNKTYKALYEFLTEILEIEVIRPESLRNAFNKNKSFLPRRDDKWLIKLYKLYASVPNLFSEDRAGSNMLTAEFIKTSKGTFVSPYRRSDNGTQDDFRIRGYEDASYLPNIFLPGRNTADMEDINFVDENILQKCRSFFTKTLKLQEPNEYEFFIHDFRKRYQHRSKISDKQHVADLKRLTHFLEFSDYRDEITGLINSYFKLRCTKEDKTIYVSPGKEKIFFSLNAYDMSIKNYYAHVITHAYVDEEFYNSKGVDRSMLASLGVSDEVAIGMNTVQGEYITNNTGRHPEWHTYTNFRWNLSLDKLDEVLEYISSHPKSTDAMTKSSFIFHFLQMHEDRLVGKVYIGGSTPDIPRAYSDIITKLRRDNPERNYYGEKWNGKWLFTANNELVSQKEITRWELHPQLYGDVNPESDLYEILGFSSTREERLQEASVDYDKLDEDTKNQYFEIELERRFGLSISDLEDSFASGFDTDGKSPSTTSRKLLEFPSANIRNWDSLQKHAAEALVFASPVKYEYKVRKIRVSRPDSEISAYLKSMYRIDRTSYACQMCHKSVQTFEKCQITIGMEKELDAMYLCLCPNCASQYRQIRSDANGLQKFLNKISSLSNSDIDIQDPVKINLGNESIWFTQAHIGEIRELLELKKAADEYVDSPAKNTKKGTDTPAENANPEHVSEEEHDPDPDAESVIAGTDVYKEFIGKRVHHKKDGYGIVKSCDCDEDRIIIEFEEGENSGQTKPYSLKFCLSHDMIQVV